MYRSYIKPVMDFLLALVLVVMLCPFLLIGLIAAAIDNRGNPLFIHVRPGHNEKPIGLLKLRTMLDEFDSQGKPRTNIERITRIGRFLRLSSMDELPQLFNVLRGELSLVGPRPLEMRYLPHYSPRQRLRHCVKPGITGLAQVNGRNSLSWEEKFELDVEYTESISFWLDLRILIKTAMRVFKTSDINSDAGHTVRPFVAKNTKPNLDYPNRDQTGKQSQPKD